MISLQNLSYKVADFNLNISLDIDVDEYFVLFGSTGCGKTSTIECICGLRDVNGGKILINGEDVTNADPRSRRVGYVPQDGALFYHLTVRQNIGFSLKVQGIDSEEEEKAVQEISEKLHISHLLERKIIGLSGGERQRVALGRALVCRPDILLLDEPVSALDEYTRESVCRELVNLHREMEIPIIHICHSFDEARSVATKIGIMNAGRFVQIGTPDELVMQPKNIYVARILGLQNIFSGKGIKENGQSYVKLGDVKIKADVPEGEIDLMIRPWQVVLDTDGMEKPVDASVLEGRISDIIPKGACFRAEIECGFPLMMDFPRCMAEKASLKSGQNVKLYIPENAVYVLED